MQPVSARPSQGEGPFTVLAPTDAAFEAAFEALGITAEELLADTETLTAILLYHVLGQEADSQLVATLDGSSVATLNPQAVDINVVDGQIMINEATVVSADLTPTTASCTSSTPSCFRRTSPKPSA